MRGIVFAATGFASAAVLALSGILSIETNTATAYNFVIALVGIYLAIIIPLAASYYNQPAFDIEVGAPAVATDGSWKILKIQVVSERNYVRDPRPSVTLYAGENTFVIPGKWDSQPEPVLIFPDGHGIFQGWLTRVERTVDVPPKQREALAIAIKFKDESGFYGFDAWSYANNRRHPLAKIDGLTKVEVKVEVRSGDTTKARRFTIENPAGKLTGFSLGLLKAEAGAKEGKESRTAAPRPEADELRKKAKLIQFIATLTSLVGIMFAIISSSSKQTGALFGFFVVVQVIGSLLAYSKLTHGVRWDRWWRVGYVFDSALIAISFSSVVIVALGFSLAQVLAYSALTANTSFGIYSVIILSMSATFWYAVFRELALREP